MIFFMFLMSLTILFELLYFVRGNQVNLKYSKQMVKKILMFQKYIQNNIQKEKMNLVQIDRLSRQTQHKSQSISRLQNEISCLKSKKIDIVVDDIQTQKQLISRIESQKKQLRKQIEQLKRKQQQNGYEQQNVQNRYLLVLQKLQDDVQQGKKKFNKLNNKISPLIDYDSVRLSIMTELSQHHQIQMQKYKHTIQIQKDEIQKLKREKALVQHKIQTLKIDYSDRIRQLSNSVKNESSQNQLTALTLEMSKQIQNRLKLSYQTVRKEAQYYKEKYFTTQKKYQQKVLGLERQIKDLKGNGF